jgi:hypothetical protein
VNIDELLFGKNEKILESNYSEIMRVKVDPISWENSPKSWQELIKIFDDELTDQN